MTCSTTSSASIRFGREVWTEVVVGSIHVLLCACAPMQEGRYIQTALSVKDPDTPCPAGLKRIEVRLYVD